MARMGSSSANTCHPATQNNRGTGDHFALDLEPIVGNHLEIALPGGRDTLTTNDCTARRIDEAMIGGEKLAESASIVTIDRIDEAANGLEALTLHRVLHAA